MLMDGCHTNFLVSLAVAVVVVVASVVVVVVAVACFVLPSLKQ